MAHIYLDTSNKLIVGLLDDQYNWLEYRKFDVRRTSDIVHQEIYNLLNENNLLVKDLKSLYLLAGPGSYTGMRVSEGIAQVFELEGVNIYSFTSFRIFDFIGSDNSLWIANAFKGEFYILSEESQGYLVKSDDLDSEIAGRSIYTHHEDSLDLDDVTYLEKIVNESPQTVFKYVNEKSFRDKPFYFRPTELEFKKSKC